MFQKLKTPTFRQEEFYDMDLDSSKRGFHKSPGTTSSVVKGNETRLTRCVNCGWICDKERDVRMPEDSWAGLGISYSGPFTAKASPLSDARGANGALKPDTYYMRTVRGGCACCGSFLYDKKPSSQGMEAV